MKIEKINDNQIRCTLTRDDLAAHEIRLGELTYGSEKIRALLQDMISKAAADFGFVVDNTPLMIEAIPLSPEKIIVIITKVDSPDELDSRFSRFSFDEGIGGTDSYSKAESLTGLDDILNLISRITQAKKEAREKEEKAAGMAETAEPALPEAEDADSFGRFFLFRDIQSVIRAAGILDPSTRGTSSLYKNPDDGNYYLIVRKGSDSPELFNKICNMLSEFSLSVDYIPGVEELFTEHMQVILKDDAVIKLREL